LRLPAAHDPCVPAELVEDYWACEITSNPNAYRNKYTLVWKYKTTRELTEKYRGTSYDITTFIKNSDISLQIVGVECKNCGRGFTYTSRSDHTLQWHLNNYNDTVYRPQCDECRDAEHQRDEAERERRRQAKEQAALDARAQRLPQAQAEFGRRLIGECPQCLDGFVIIKLNSTTLEAFAGCTCYRKAWNGSSCGYAKKFRVAEQSAAIDRIISALQNKQMPQPVELLDEDAVLL
jgi:hypothetical protein